MVIVPLLPAVRSSESQRRARLAATPAATGRRSRAGLRKRAGWRAAPPFVVQEKRSRRRCRERHACLENELWNQEARKRTKHCQNGRRSFLCLDHPCIFNRIECTESVISTYRCEKSCTGKFCARLIQLENDIMLAIFANVGQTSAIAIKFSKFMFSLNFSK